MRKLIYLYRKTIVLEVSSVSGTLELSLGLPPWERVNNRERSGTYHFLSNMTLGIFFLFLINVRRGSKETPPFYIIKLNTQMS